MADAFFKLTGGEEFDDAYPLEEFSISCKRLQKASGGIADADEEIGTSSQLFSRLMELRQVDDNLTIDKLLETLEDEDDCSADESEEHISHQPSRFEGWGTVNTRLGLDSFEPTSPNGYIPANEWGTNATPWNAPFEPQSDGTMGTGRLDSINLMDLTETDRSILTAESGSPGTAGLASRLRKVLHKLGRHPNGDGRGQQKEVATTEVEVPPTPLSGRVFIPTPSDDDWNDFTNISQFTQAAGLEGLPNRIPYNPMWL